MAQFKYVAKGPDGQTVSDTREVQDARLLASTLRAEGLVPVSITEVSAQAIFGDQKQKQTRGRIKLTDVAEFVRQLSVMLQASVSLVTALEDLAAQEEKTLFVEVLDDVRNKVVSGAPLSVVMKEHPKVFSPLLCAMVRAGEETGNLEQVLADLASYMESQIKLRRKIRTALAYPVFVSLVFCAAVAFMFFFLLPKFQGIFSSLGSKLPLISQLALGFSAWVHEWILLILVVVALLVAAVRLAGRTPTGKALLDNAKLKLPLVGPLCLKVALVRFLETLATLQRSGVPILMSLEIAKDTVGNRAIEQDLELARHGLMQGSFLSRELARSEHFPRMMIRMIAVGEETGRTDELLSRTASFYRDEAEARIQNITALIEPVIMVLMGIVVGFVVFAVYLPIFKLASAVGGH